MHLRSCCNHGGSSVLVKPCHAEQPSADPEKKGCIGLFLLRHCLPGQAGQWWGAMPARPYQQIAIALETGAIFSPEFCNIEHAYLKVL